MGEGSSMPVGTEVLQHLWYGENWQLEVACLNLMQRDHTTLLVIWKWNYLEGHSRSWRHSRQPYITSYNLCIGIPDFSIDGVVMSCSLPLSPLPTPPIHSHSIHFFRTPNPPHSSPRLFSPATRSPAELSGECFKLRECGWSQTEKRILMHL